MVQRVIVALASLLLLLSLADLTVPAFGDDPPNVRRLELPDSPLDPRIFEAATDGLQASVVLGADDRVRVSPPTSAPWRSIAYLGIATGNGGGAICTGTFVGSRVLLTTAHCLYNSATGGWATVVWVVPGRDGDSQPFGSAYADMMWVPSEWMSTGHAEWDWGLVRLPNDTLGGSVGHMTLLVLTDQSLQYPSLGPVISGYPADKLDGTQWWDQEYALRSFDEKLLTYDIDTAAGQSGAAIWRSWDLRVIGIHIGGVEGQYNVGNRVRQSMIDRLVGACAFMGCSIASEVEPTPTPTRTPTPVGTPTPTPTRNHRIYLPAIQRQTDG